MTVEKDGKPTVENPPEVLETTETDVTTEQLVKPPETLPDEKPSEVETLKAERDENAKQAKEAKEANESLEKRLKDNQEYISRTRNVEKESEPPKPAKSFEEYIDDIKNKFSEDPSAGLEKVVRDLAFNQELDRQKYEERITQSEDRAFKKMLALNPESNKVLKDVEKLDEECPDMKGLSYERKVEFINLRKSGVTKHETDARDKINREVEIAGGVGGSGVRGVREKVPAWVNDPEVVKDAQGRFKTKQELLNWADPDKAKAMYEQSKQKAG